MDVAMEEWVREGLSVAYRAAQKSPDPSTQNGAVLLDRHGSIAATTCNEFPRGVLYLDDRWERPLKYRIIEHAERNAIYEAARLGVPIEGGTLMCPWAACTDCARGIIQAGIRTLIRHKESSDRSPATWFDDIAIADQMLKEAGVTIVDYSGKFDVGELRHSGQVWLP